MNQAQWRMPSSLHSELKQDYEFEATLSYNVSQRLNTVKPEGSEQRPRDLPSQVPTGWCGYRSSLGVIVFLTCKVACRLQEFPLGTYLGSHAGVS